MPNPKPSDETALRILGHTVRSFREAKGLSLRQFAKVTGINRSHLSKIELGQISVTMDTLLYLAHSLDIEVSRLLRPLDTRRELYVPRKNLP